MNRILVPAKPFTILNGDTTIGPEQDASADLVASAVGLGLWPLAVVVSSHQFSSSPETSVDFWDRSAGGPGGPVEPGQCCLS